MKKVQSEITINDVEYIVTTAYVYDENGNERVVYEHTEPKNQLPSQSEPSQLDRIETQLDDADTIQAELLFNQANADVDTQLILETLAEILLNQQGV